MDIKINKKNDEIIIKVVLQARKKIEKVKVFKTSDAKKHVLNDVILEKNQKLLLIKKPPHDLMNNTTSLSGEWVFKLKNSVDILKNNVKMNTTKIEAESPQGGEQKSEASLPYGLKKQTKPRRRATRKKKTEE